MQLKQRARREVVEIVTMALGARYGPGQKRRLTNAGREE